MTDFLKKYHKKKITGNVFMVLGALVMAFGINFFLIDGSDFGQNMKTSVLDAQNIEEKADIFLENNNGTLTLKNSKTMENLTNFSVSLSYNPEVIDISNVLSDLGETSILGEKSDGIITIIVNANGNNLDKNNTLLKIFAEKKEKQSSGLNLVNGNFTDTSGEKYELTTSGIIF